MSEPICYEIKDWSLHFENSESRRYKSLSWVPVKNKHDGKSYRRVSKLPNGVQVFCAWSLIIQVASKMPTRGVLRDEDGPITTADLADMTGFPENIFEMAFKALSQPQIGWLIPSNYVRCPTIPAGAQQNPVNRTEQNRTEQTGKQESASAFDKLRGILNETYKRKPTDAWSNIEETTLFEVSKRPGVLEELEHILRFRRKMPTDERGRYFPQTVYSLLDRWTETLDKARVQCPIKKPMVAIAKASPKPEAPVSIDELKLSLEWTLANTPHAKETIATLERRIKELK